MDKSTKLNEYVIYDKYVKMKSQLWLKMAKCTDTYHFF